MIRDDNIRYNRICVFLYNYFTLPKHKNKVGNGELLLLWCVTLTETSNCVDVFDKL